MEIRLFPEFLGIYLRQMIQYVQKPIHQMVNGLKRCDVMGCFSDRERGEGRVGKKETDIYIYIDIDRYR